MSNALEHQQSTPLHDGAVRRERLNFSSFTFTRSPSGRCVVHVELEYDNKRYTGTCEGQSSPIGDLRLGSEAAMQAIEAFSDGNLGLELMGVKLVRAFDSNVVIVSLTQRAQRGTRLVGCFLADQEPVRGAALAVMNATNRVLGNFVSR
jgi:hypothetical protein